MRLFLICTTVFAFTSFASAQRPFYAGLKPIGYPELHSRFKENETETETTDLENRFGVDKNGVSTTTERLPIDALGQKELIDRIKTWPREKWPFWYINYLAIEEHRKTRPSQPGSSMTAGQSNQQLPNPNQSSNIIPSSQSTIQPSTNPDQSINIVTAWPSNYQPSSITIRPVIAPNPSNPSQSSNTNQVTAGSQPNRPLPTQPNNNVAAIQPPRNNRPTTVNLSQRIQPSVPVSNNQNQGTPSGQNYPSRGQASQNIPNSGQKSQVRPSRQNPNFPPDVTDPNFKIWLHEYMRQREANYWRHGRSFHG